MNGFLHGVNGLKIWRTESKQSSDEQDKKIPQSALEVHHQQLQGNYGFARARKACTNKAKPIFARPRQTCLRWRFVYLRLALPVAVVPPLLRLAPVAKRRFAQANAVRLAICPILPGVVNLVGDHSFRVAAEALLVRFQRFNQGHAFVKAVP